MTIVHVTGVGGLSLGHFFDLIALRIVEYVGKFDIGNISNYLPSLLVGIKAMPSSEQESETRRGESSIRISASLLITILLAILAGHWGLFMMYMDSQNAGISESITHTNESLLLEIKSVVKTVEANRDSMLVNRNTLSSLTSRLNTIEKELAAELNSSVLAINTKLDNRYMDILGRFATVDKDINRIDAGHSAILHEIYGPIGPSNHKQAK